MQHNKKIKVISHGKCKSRTVLGIVNAYVKLHPNTTLKDLRKAFPDEMLENAHGKHIIVPLKEIEGQDIRNYYFTEEDEIIHLRNGEKVVVANVWIQESFDKIADQAYEYQIGTDFKDTSKPFEKGGYYLEFIHDKSKLMWIIFVILLLLALILMLLKGCNSTDNQPIKTQVTKVVEPKSNSESVDSISKVNDMKYVILFSKAKSDLTTESKEILNEFVTKLQANPNTKAMFIGHASSEGYVYYNNILSVDRAKKAMDYVVSKGIKPSRLMYKGEGSSKPKDVKNPTGAINRRTEFVILN